MRLKAIALRFFLVILFTVVTTARHEGGHALAAKLEGAEISELRLFPGFREDVGFYFGFVEHDEQTTWRTTAAPFVLDLASASICLLILLKLNGPAWLRLAILALGIVSPLIDLVYNYQGGLWRESADVTTLLGVLPPAMVHVSFLAAIGFCLAALKWSRRAAERG